MGVTIHYRGTMDNVTRIEEMEDRILDVALALGGRATVWRSFADHDPSRAIRGLMLEMTPGQETMSLLVSPEGHLINLFEIEQAEKQPLDEAPYCFVKTQFGSEQGHIAIVYLLDALKEQYFSDLDVSDESEFYEHRDPQVLSQKMTQLGDAIRSLEKGVEKYGLNAEAAEDPEIVATRIERVARLVAKNMRAAAADDSNTLMEDDDHDFDQESTLEEEVTAMDKAHRQNQLRSERMARRIADATAAGMSNEEAFNLALKQEGLGPPRLDNEFGNDQDDVEPWRKSLESPAFDEQTDIESDQQHPTVQRAEKLLLEIMKLDSKASRSDSFAMIATRGLIDVVGGLVQATCDRDDRALTIVQLKRALKGHAFCRGAIFGLRASDQIDQTTSERFHGELEAILESIHELMAEAWDEDDSR